jgi:demethylmenaquinone methyltransferase/2-methoxy-6-polyprenyl-1,4-benzoquinol methylase
MSQRSAAPPRSFAPAGDDQSPERIRGMFAAIAPTYDRLNHLLSGRLDRRWRALAARAAVEGLRPCRRLLDVATGTGDLARALERAARREWRNAGGSSVNGNAAMTPPIIYGADFTRPMLVRAGSKYGWNGFRWIEADGMRLPLPDGAVDACTIAFGLRNMMDRAAALAEMARVVRPGGRVVILEFSRPTNPLVRTLYDFYSHRVLPRVGAWISGSDAYRYLAASIREFWGPTALVDQMRLAGLTDVRWRGLMLGVVCLHVGVKGC